MNRKLLSPPADWQAFEDLCHRLWSSIWGDGTQKNGRQGQPQNGVDIYGVRPYNGTYGGVQCKGKNGNYGSALKASEVDAECKNAVNFIPSISKFIMATTSPRDAQIQQHCRELSANHNFPFEVETWSWDDISSEILYRKEIMDFYYQEFPLARTNKSIFDNLFFSYSRIEAFFSRDHIRNLCDAQTMGMLAMLSFEIIDNAFRHGHAQECSLEIEGNTLIIKDNGAPFNALEIENGRGGMMTIEVAKQKFAPIAYKYENQTNIITVPIPVQNVSSGKCEIKLDADMLVDGNPLIYNQFVIPPKTKEIVINTTNTCMPVSGVCRIFERFIMSINDDISVTIYLPQNMEFFVERLSTIYPKKNVKIIIR